MTETFLKRTWIDIDLDKLLANYETAKSLTKATVTCVVKSNAYGHGAVRVAQALQAAGCESFAVSCAREGLELRRAGITGEILVMGLTEADILPACVREGLTLTVATAEGIREAEAAAQAEGRTVKAHLKVDTGFHRLGFDCTETAADEIARAAKELGLLRLTGLYSHLGLINEARDRMQFDNLCHMRALLAARGLELDDVHICDSIGLVRYPAWHGSRVRVGAMLFGVRPYRTEHMAFADEETLALRTTVAQVRWVEAGEIVGYSDDQVLEKRTRIATLCAGYGDGYPRCLSNGRGEVSIRGRRAKVVGLICMDQMMVDVTDIPDCATGDVATLLGDGIGYMEYADWAHTNRNECITILSRRPLRVYHAGGRVVTVLDSMLDERRDLE